MYGNSHKKHIVTNYHPGMTFTSLLTIITSLLSMNALLVVLLLLSGIVTRSIGHILLPISIKV